jgi:hypothetical protein
MRTMTWQSTDSEENLLKSRWNLSPAVRPFDALQLRNQPHPLNSKTTDFAHLDHEGELRIRRSGVQILLGAPLSPAYICRLVNRI